MVGIPAAKRAMALKKFRTELSVMVRLRSPRTVQVVGVVTTDPTFLGLVTEHCAGGSLREALDKGGASSSQQRVWSTDVALGMAHRSVYKSTSGSGRRPCRYCTVQSYAWE